MKIGEKIKQGRKNNNMNQIELAEKLGINITTLSRWENDKTTPNSDDIEKIAKILNMEASSFFKKNEKNNDLSDKDDILVFKNGIQEVRMLNTEDNKNFFLSVIKEMLKSPTISANTNVTGQNNSYGNNIIN